MLMSGTDNHLVGLGTMAEVLPFARSLQGRPGYEGHPPRQVAGELFGQAYVRGGDWKLVAARAPHSGPPPPGT